MEKRVQDYTQDILAVVRSNTSPAAMSDKLGDFHANDIADAMPRLTVQERCKLYRILELDMLSDIFEYTDSDNAAEYVKEMDVKKGAAILSRMETDALVEVLHKIDKAKKKLLFELMDDDVRHDIEMIASFDEDEIGSRMTTNCIIIRENLTVKQAMNSLVEQAAKNDNISTIFVVTESQKFYGAIDLKDLIIARQDKSLEDLVATSYPYVYAEEDIDDCIEELKAYSEDSIPVLDNDNRLLGVITSSNIIDLVDDEMGEDYAMLAGLTAEEDLKEPLKESWQKPAVFLKKRRMIMKKKVFAVILAAAAICGSLSPVYAADSELVLYTWEGMFPQEVLDGFEEETGCKIVYSNFDTDETMLEKVSMAKGGDYDVVIADDYILEKIVEEGLATKLDKDKISNWGNINPLYQGQFYDEKDEYTVPYGAGIPLIVYDPEEVDLDIKGYSDLWDPSLEDSIALIGNYRVINGITLLTMGKSMNEEDVDAIAEAGEKLVELAPNVRMIQDDNTQNALLNGEASVAFLYTSQVTAALAENPDLKVVYPEEGLGFGVMGMFIPSEAPNADAAYQFVDYILRPEVAAQCFNYIGYYCTNKAADELVDESLVVPDSVTSGESIKNVSQEAEEQYNKNWTEFKAACD